VHDFEVGFSAIIWITA